MASRSQEQIEEILQRKRSLSLNLRRHCLPASPIQQNSSSCDDYESPLETPTGQNGEVNDENHNLKHQIAVALDLVYPEPNSTPGTTEAFHTAAANSPEFLDAKEEAEEEDDSAFKTSVQEVREFDKSTVEEVQDNSTLEDTLTRNEVGTFGVDTSLSVQT